GGDRSTILRSRRSPARLRRGASRWGPIAPRTSPGQTSRAGRLPSRSPRGPNRTNTSAWDDIWGWAIPKSISAERKKLAKEMLAAMMADEEGQMKLWKATGAPPPNTQFWPKIAAQEPFMKLLQESVLQSPDKVRGAYYFPQWPAVHKAFNDAVTKAVTGKREDIGKVLSENAPLGSHAAQETTLWGRGAPGPASGAGAHLEVRGPKRTRGA